MFCKLPGELYQHSWLVQRNCMLLLLLALLKLWQEESSKFSSLCGDERGCHESTKRTSSIMNAEREVNHQCKTGSICKHNSNKFQRWPYFTITVHSTDWVWPKSIAIAVFLRARVCSFPEQFGSTLMLTLLCIVYTYTVHHLIHYHTDNLPWHLSWRYSQET